MLKKNKCYKVALLISLFFSAKGTTAQLNEIKLSFIGDKYSQAFMGIKQGINEANVQGKFLGKLYSLTNTPSESTAIFAAVDSEHIEKLSEVYSNKPIFNLTLDNNELRSKCFNNVLHIVPSLAMKEAAEAQWVKMNPESNARAQTWHATFKKYAAGQLNSRFTKSYNHKMTDTAWAGWAAVRLLTDSTARNQFNDETSLLKFIKSDLAFDGQKGMSLNFRETGQLRQPLLLIDKGKIVGEAPVRGVANSTDLDSLGLTHCSI